MATIRIKKNKNYTVMSNIHLRDKNLSLKTKGLLSIMLSLPEDWDYTEMGLVKITGEGRDSIRKCLKQLEDFHYLTRKRLRDERGHMTGTEYIIYEQPQTDKENDDESEFSTEKLPMSSRSYPVSENPTLDKPTLANPMLAKPAMDEPTLVKPTQLNKDLSTTYITNNLSINHSISECKINDQIDGWTDYEKIIKQNIDYDSARERLPLSDLMVFENLVSLMVEFVSVKRSSVLISGNIYPYELVKSTFLKLNFDHLEYVVSCLKNRAVKINNIKAYMITTLFNSYSTMDTYTFNEVNGDIYS